MKRVLMLAYFFPPLGGGGCQRTLKLVRYLEPLGWGATVVTTRDQDYWIADPTLLAEVPHGTEVLRVSGLTPHRALGWLRRRGVPLERRQGERSRGALSLLRALQSFVAVPDGFAGWARAAERAAADRLAAGGIDAIWTTSPPDSTHLAGLELKRRTGLPWIADFRDPWVGRATYRAPTAWHDRAHRRLERAVVEAADRVTMVSEAMLDTYRRRHPRVPPGHFALLPNGYDPDDWARAGAAAAPAPGRFTLLHAGQLAHRPTVRTLLDAARRLLDEEPALAAQLRLVFLGGNEQVSDRDLARAGVASLVERRDAAPHHDALAAMRAADALVLLGHGGAGDALVYTGKIYEYLTSRRPVLAILDAGPAADLLRAARVGPPPVAPGDVAGAAAALRVLIAASREPGHGPGRAAPPPVPPALAPTRQEIAARAASLLAEIAPLRRP